ncbi:hypothetical protein A6C57_08580 [Fibrella sp. ES10-3-2-2]|nr:hypothetical protein A6C57_08580 [Fibrella sp. ES10-3-2-2]
MPQLTNDTRVCLHCSTEFIPKGKQVYCCNSCRVGACDARKKQEAEQMKGILQEQADELDALKTAPKSRKETVQEVNPDWQLFAQRVETQRQAYQTAKDELCELKAQVRDLINIAPNIRMGISVGIIIGLIPIAVGFDSKKGRSLSMTFFVLSTASLLLCILVGYYVGRSIGNQRLASDPELIGRLDHISKRQDKLEERLEIEKAFLKELELKLSTIPKFSKEIVTFTDENGS